MAPLFQFSIRGLLWAVTFLALGIAALLNANSIWQGASWALVLYALTASILLVVYRREEKRAWWLGFAVFGWLYLLVFLTSQAPSQLQFWVRSDPLRYYDLPATQLADWLHHNLLPPSRREAQIAVSQPVGYSGPIPVSGGDMMTGSGMMPGGMMPGAGGMMPGGMMPGMGQSGMVAMTANPNYVPIENFMHIFHALALLLVAVVGGKTCQIIYGTRPAGERNNQS